MLLCFFLEFSEINKALLSCGCSEGEENFPRQKIRIKLFIKQVYILLTRAVTPTSNVFSRDVTARRVNEGRPRFVSPETTLEMIFRALRKFCISGALGEREKAAIWKSSMTIAIQYVCFYVMRIFWCRCMWVGVGKWVLMGSEMLTLF